MLIGILLIYLFVMCAYEILVNTNKSTLETQGCNRVVIVVNPDNSISLIIPASAPASL